MNFVVIITDTQCKGFSMKWIGSAIPTGPGCGAIASGVRFAARRTTPYREETGRVGFPRKPPRRVRNQTGSRNPGGGVVDRSGGLQNRERNSF